MTPQLVLLDLDGTLTDSAPGITASVAHAFTTMGFDLPSQKELRGFVGPPLAESFLAYGVPPEQVNETISVYREMFVDGGMFDNSVYDGIPACLTRLRGAGIRMALATSKPEIYAEQITTYFGLDEFLEAEFGAASDLKRSSKSDVITYGLEQLKDSEQGLPELDRILMVGDRSYDVLGARANGLDCVGVSWGYAPAGELTAAGALSIVDSPAELADLILAG